MEEQFSKDGAGTPPNLRQQPQELRSLSGAAAGLGDTLRHEVLARNTSLASDCRNAGELDKARELLDAVREIARSLPLARSLIVKANYAFERTMLCVRERNAEGTVDEAIDGLRLIAAAPPGYRAVLGNMHVVLLTFIANSWSSLDRPAPSIQKIFNRAFDVAAGLTQESVLAPGLLNCEYGRFLWKKGNHPLAILSVERGIDLYRFNVESALQLYAEHANLLVHMYLASNEETKARQLLDEAIRTCGAKQLSSSELLSLRVQRALLHAQDLEITPASILSHQILTNAEDRQMLSPQANLTLQVVRAIKMGLDGLARYLPEADDIRKQEDRLLGAHSEVAAKFARSIQSLAHEQDDAELGAICGDLASMLSSRRRKGS